MKEIELLTNLKNYDCWDFKKYPLSKEEAEVIIKALEKPERPKGKWIREYDGQCETCSLCHRTRYSGHDNNFCPNCGAEMEAKE